MNKQQYLFETPMGKFTLTFSMFPPISRGKIRFIKKFFYCAIKKYLYLHLKFLCLM